MTDATDHEGTPNGAQPPVPSSLARAQGPEPAALATLAAIFDDLQYVLGCCEHLVAALDRPAPPAADPVLVEALWTGALVGYARCFSGRAGVLGDHDLQALELGDQASTLHAALLKLRDHYASRHDNPRETITVGLALTDEGTPQGVAVTSAPEPPVEVAAVRLLGRIAYGLSATVDTRMQQAQEAVLTAATAMSPQALRQLPRYEVVG